LSLAAASLVLIVGATSVPLVRAEGGGSSTTTAGPVLSASSLVSAWSDTATAPLGVVSTSAQGSLATGSATGASVDTASAGTLSQSLKIESRGGVDLTVPNDAVQSALDKLGAWALHDEGFVQSTSANASAQATGAYSDATIVLQVPQRLFATLLTQVEGVGKATSVDVQSSDATSQYVGLQARIAALELSRHQYLTIMSHASSVGDILAVQAQLNSLQSQIEQQQGQLGLLNSEITYGSLSVQVIAANHVASTIPPTGLRKALHQSVTGFVVGVEWLIRIVGPALFVVVLLGALVALTRVARRAWERRRA
jgi:hypothetical protein